MTPFQRVYAVVSHIPKGEVMTYQQVANLSGVRSPRIVGFALHSNKDPQAIPCHRVVSKQGGLAKGYAFGGIKKQKEQLEKEGIGFLPNGCVDLNTHLLKTAFE